MSMDGKMHNFTAGNAARLFAVKLSELRISLKCTVYANLEDTVFSYHTIKPFNIEGIVQYTALISLALCELTHTLLTRIIFSR